MHRLGTGSRRSPASVSVLQGADPAALAENAILTITTAFALSRLLAVATAKLADAFNPPPKLPDAEWDALLQSGALSPEAFEVLRHSATERPFTSGACECVARSVPAYLRLNQQTPARSPAPWRQVLTNGLLLGRPQRRKSQWRVRVCSVWHHALQLREQISVGKWVAVILRYA